MRRPRLTIRHLMAIVLAVAFAVAGPAFLWRRSVRFERVARFHEREAMKVGRLFSDLDLYLMTTSIQLGPGFTPEERRLILDERERRFSTAKPAMIAVEYHSAMEDKYKRVASRPWLTVSADPPAPIMPSEGELKSLRAEFDWFLRDVE